METNPHEIGLPSKLPPWHARKGVQDEEAATDEVLRVLNHLKGKVEQFDGYAMEANVGDEMCKSLAELGYHLRWNNATKAIERHPGASK